MNTNQRQHQASRNEKTEANNTNERLISPTSVRFEKAVVCSSLTRSHFRSSRRQFRRPLEDRVFVRKSIVQFERSHDRTLPRKKRPDSLQPTDFPEEID
ncbi:hypothetical protein TcasGA2_TC012398 [Tribolium castaneum]|uniref:Uncharacterized protein n=1 Tax=Tribolium castaneum TaxID=7070 RepID=D6X227_TRICA|nr:hypothetical protein TcasGA2_TC012398 [Tribolium castaneum]